MNKEEFPKFENEKQKLPLSWRIKQAYLAAILGAGFLTGCGTIENRAKAYIEAAGLPQEAMNDSDLIWAAENGATADELRDHRNSKVMQNEAELRSARATQQAELTPPDPNKWDLDDPSPDDFRIFGENNSMGIEMEMVPGEKNVFSFEAPQNLVITELNFMDAVREALGDFCHSGQAFFVAVVDDMAEMRSDNKETVKIFSNSDANKGYFMAYGSDKVYVSTNISELESFLESKNFHCEEVFE